MRDLDDRMPTDEVLDGFVSWSTLEDALKGLKLEFDQFSGPQDNQQTSTIKDQRPSAQETDQTLTRNDQMLTRNDQTLVTQESDPDLVKTADQMVSQVTAMEAEGDSTKDQVRFIMYLNSCQDCMDDINYKR